MKKIIYFLTLVAVLVSSCNYSEYFAKAKTYYSQFKNSELQYTWDFNESLTNEKGGTIGGRTFNPNYFQLKKYNQFREVTTSLNSLLKRFKYINPPYNIQFKHEEGHIYQLKILNRTNLDELYDNTICNLVDPTKEYFVSVTEGSADYYSISYFNNSLSDEYTQYEKRNLDNERFKRYYQGFLFTNYTISKLIYSDVKNFILNVCTKKQYNLYEDYVKTLT